MNSLILCFSISGRKISARALSVAGLSRSLASVSPGQRVQRDRMRALPAFRAGVLADPLRLAVYQALARRRRVPLDMVIRSVALKTKR